MEIKGPTAPRPTEIPAQSVRPAEPGAATSPSTGQTSSPNSVQLSPALFTVGQLLEVVVAKVEANALLLMLKNPILDENGQRINLQLRAPAGFPAQEGQQLMVQVKSLSNGLPQLQVLAARDEALNPASVLHTAQQQQRPLPPLYANLGQLQQLQSKQLLDVLPALVRERIQTLWRSLPDTSQIQKPTGLKQAMHYSGPFLESSLLALARGEGRGYPVLDVKTGLLRLASAIRAQLDTATPRMDPSGAVRQSSTANRVPIQPNNPAATPASPDKNPGAAQTLHAQIPQAQARAAEQITRLANEHLLNQLLQQTEGGLARILTQQLHAASHEQTQRPLWVLELPVRHENGVDVFDMRIQRDPEEQAERAKDAAHRWTVMLGFELEGLGPVRAQISLMQNMISTFWWAQQPATVELFHQHLEQLQHRISAAGLKVDKLQCKLGIPDANQPAKALPIANTSVDEKL